MLGTKNKLHAELQTLWQKLICACDGIVDPLGVKHLAIGEQERYVKLALQKQLFLRVLLAVEYRRKMAYRESGRRPPIREELLQDLRENVGTGARHAKGHRPQLSRDEGGEGAQVEVPSRKARTRDGPMVVVDGLIERRDDFSSLLRLVILLSLLKQRVVILLSLLRQLRPCTMKQRPLDF